MMALKILIASIIASIIRTQETSESRMLLDVNDPIYDKFFNVRNINCTNFNCPPINACLSEKAGAPPTICKCQPGYVDFVVYSKDINGQSVNATVPASASQYCGYEQKKQLTAFLLQFFVFCGAGQFYVGNIKYAVPQLLLCLSPCLICCLQLCFGIKRGDAQGGSGPALVIMILNCLFSLTVCAWWLADVIIFGMNNHLDSNGVPLKPW